MLTCPSAEKVSENIRVKTMEGSIYTVDDVSDLLGIPRPTLYRYLREYSIPHLRQGGRIRIPEDSFDRIREARDLHKEGLAQAVPLRAEGRSRLPGTLVAEPITVRESEAPALASPGPHLPTGRFGALGRRRRRGALVVLSALLIGLLLILLLPALNEEETATSDQPAPDAVERPGPPEARPAGAGSDAAGEEGGGGDPTDGVATDAAPPQAEATSEEQSTRTTQSPQEPISGVPDVSGQPLDEAARNLSEAGYTLAAIRTVKSQEEPGTVTGTEPASGTEARPNAPVVLTMSAGPTGVFSAVAASASASATSTSSANAAASASVSSTSASASASPSP